MAGYSTRSLSQKLGLKPDYRMFVVGAPRGFAALLEPLPAGARFMSRLSGTFDYVHVFARSVAELDKEVPRMLPRLDKHGSFWISWPKRSSRLETDLTEADVRASGLGAGLVDVKVCAIDETWSGLKFVYRRANRASDKRTC